MNKPGRGGCLRALRAPVAYAPGASQHTATTHVALQQQWAPAELACLCMGSCQRIGGYGDETWQHGRQLAWVLGPEWQAKRSANTSRGLRRLARQRRLSTTSRLCRQA